MGIWNTTFSTALHPARGVPVGGALFPVAKMAPLLDTEMQISRPPAKAATYMGSTGSVRSRSWLYRPIRSQATHSSCFITIKKSSFKQNSGIPRCQASGGPPRRERPRTSARGLWPEPSCSPGPTDQSKTDQSSVSHFHQTE